MDFQNKINNNYDMNLIKLKKLKNKLFFKMYQINNIETVNLFLKIFLIFQ